MMNKTMMMLVTATLLCGGCNKEKSEAQQAARDIEAACDGDKAKGQELGKEWYGKNAAFKKAVDDASQTWKISDPGKFNYCGVAMVEVSSRLGA